VTQRVTSPEFVGRERELASLVAGLDRAADGRPAVALVAGESGVGKTRLVAELAGHARERGARVLTGECVALGDGEMPYAPIVGALRSVDAETLADALGGAASGLAPLLPQLGRPDGEGDSALSQGRVVELLLALLGGLAEEAPLVLVFEDVHWADRSSRDFLAFFVRNAGQQRVLLVATYRTDELHRRHPLRALLAEAERAPIVERVALERFTREEIVAQLTGIFGHRPDPRVVDDLFARAEGNAFFTEELAAAPAGERLPANLVDALMLRVEALSPPAQAALRIAAVAGPRVSHGLLERAADLSAEELVAGLREAVAHNVVVSDPDAGTYGFRHALMREALVDDLLPGERGPLHAALARALEAEPELSASPAGVAAELAYHWYAAHNLPAAFAASAQAGAEARRLAAFAEANAHYERAIELWDGAPAEARAAAPSLIDLIRAAAETARLAGEYDRAAALVRRALTLVDAQADPMTAALIEERLGRYLWLAGNSADALEHCQAAVALMPDDEPASRAHVLGAYAHLLMLLSRGVEALELAEPALALARAAGARRAEGSILATMCAAVAIAGDPAAGIEHGREALRIAEELGDVDEIARAYVNVGETLDYSGNLEESAELARIGMARVLELGMSAIAGLLATDRAMRLLRLGLWDEADAALSAGLDVAPVGVTGSATLADRALLDLLRGQFDEAAERMDEAERAQGHAVGSMWTGPTAATRAELALWRGGPAEARDIIDRLVADLDPNDADPFYLTPVMNVGARAAADLAVAARATGDAEGEAAAIAFGEALVERANAITAPAAFPRGKGPPEAALNAATAAAELARARGAGEVEAWRDVAERWRAFGAPYSAAYAQWRYAEALLSSGGPRADAQAAIVEAHGVAVRLRARPLAGELDALARRARVALGADEADAGAPADGDGAAARVGLTARELEVLRLVAAGQTNRAIGQTLYISEKTVSVHISRILAKLDAGGRVEAAGLAHRLGLLEEAEA
jgi:predicted ATPase/DNA-binding CsgD family transcriptional regulator